MESGNSGRAAASIRGGTAEGLTYEIILIVLTLKKKGVDSNKKFLKTVFEGIFEENPRFFFVQKNSSKKSTGETGDGIFERIPTGFSRKKI